MKLFARLCPLHLSVWLCTTTTTTYHAVQGWAAPPVVSTVSNQQRHQRQNGGGGVVTATNPPTKTVASVGWESFALLAATPKNDVASSAVTSTLTNDNYDDGASSVLTPSLQQTQSVVEQLKLILEREYLSFFNPMEQAYYAPDVTFDDPLTQLQGVRSYQNNVDMLAGRTWLGTLLFQDASIQLHSVTGGMVSTTTTSTPPTTTPTTTPSSSSGLEIQDIVTRWTLRFTFRALPWKPTARFSGISVYKVVVVDSSTGPGVQIVQQTDYWDAINLLPSASTVASTTSTETGVESAGATQQQQQPQDQYRSVPKSVAVRHFVDQLQPGGWAAIAAGPELPFSTLRVIPGDYEVRRYPSYSAVKILKYQRRDEAFSVMGLLTRGSNPLAPAFMDVNSDGTKAMTWPLDYYRPGQTDEPEANDAVRQRILSAQQDTDEETNEVVVVTVPSRVVAVRIFGDALIEPMVRRVDGELRSLLRRDGLLKLEEEVSSSILPPPTLTFAQYDAVYSMGQRRSEVHIPLPDGSHPW